MLNASPRCMRLNIQSKITRLTNTAVNRLANRPKVKRNRESLHRAGAEDEQNDRRNDGGDVRIHDRHPGVAEALLDRLGGVLPLRNSSRMRSKISTFESTPMPTVRITSGDSRQRQRRPAESQKPQQNHQVQDQRHVGVDARACGSKSA